MTHRSLRICSLLTALVMLLICMPALAEGPLYDETFEFSYMYPIHPSYTADNMYDKYLDEYLNMKVNWIQVTQADFDQKLSVVLASGELPDVIRVGSAAQLNSLIDQGAIIELDDLMEQYGQDIMAEYEKWNGLKNIYNVNDGHIYGVYGIEAIESNNCISVRQDWLDKLGMEMPVTLDDWMTAWYAFKENNLGGDYTYPIGNVINPIFDAFGVKYTTDKRFVEMDDGTLVNRYEHEHYLEALELLTKLYADGIINPYIFTQTSADLDNMVYNGYIGMVDQTGNKIQTYNIETEKTVENAWFTPTSPIKGPYGDQSVRTRAGVAAACAVITVNAKEPEKIMQYFNWGYTDEGKIISNFGIEGETFDMVDGKPVLRPEYCNYTKNLWPNGICCTFKGTIDWTNDAFIQVTFGGKTKDEMDKYELSAYQGYMEVNQGYFHDNYVQFTTPTEAELGTDLWAQLKNAEQQAIAGEITIDQFKEVLAGVKAAGMDQIMAEANEIWNSLK